MKSRMPWFLLLLLQISWVPAIGVGRVVLLGDSWGELMDTSLRQTLEEQGMDPAILNNVSVGGSTSEQWAGGDMEDLTALFAANSDARMVHVIIGGNDLLDGGDPATQIPITLNRTLDLLRQLTAVTPAPILFSGYDYLPFTVKGLTVADGNDMLDTYIEGVAAGVSREAALSIQVTVINTHGLMQRRFGLAGLGIPAGDPRLPDSTLPGPEPAFADPIHLTDEAYKIYADYLFQRFYRAALSPPIIGKPDLRVGAIGANQARLLWSAEASRSYTLLCSPVLDADLAEWKSVVTISGETGPYRRDVELLNGPMFFRLLSAPMSP